MKKVKAKKGRKPQWKWLRYRKKDLAHNVLVAVQKWIHANKGTAVNRATPQSEDHNAG